MTKGELQIMAGVLVVESKLTYPAKKQLFTFIKTEATESQLKAFLLDGKVVIVDEQSEQIINDRFMVSEAGGRVAKVRKSAMSLQVAGTPVWALYRLIRATMDICTKRCGTYEANTSRRQHCMIKCKIDGLKKQLEFAKKNSPDAVPGIQKKIEKEQETYGKSIMSFKNRGANMPEK